MFENVLGMKKIVGFSLLLILLLLGSHGFSQNYEGGIRQVDDGNGLITYEIKLVSLSSEAEGNRLKSTFLQKEGFVSVESSVADRVCTVVVLNPMRKNELADVVEYAGFEVAKSFEQ